MNLAAATDPHNEDGQDAVLNGADDSIVIDTVFPEFSERGSREYRDLADAKANGLVKTLIPAAPNGEVQEENNWLKWSIANGIFEVKSSSWHFQTTIRYTVENEVPILMDYQDVDVARAFYFAIAAGLFSLLGIYLRRLRN